MFQRMYPFQSANSHFCLTVLAVAICFTSSALGQATSGSIFGIVTDPSGAGIAQAQVRATNQLTGESRVAPVEGRGDYVFPSLPIGEYLIEVEAQGFATYRRDGIRLTLNRNARVDVTLQLESLSESVTVTEDASPVDTRQVQMGALIDAKRSTDLPLSGRNVYSLLSLVSGVTSVGARSTTGISADNDFMVVNGNRQSMNLFLLDGNANTQLGRNYGNLSPNPDAVQEIRVLTSNFNAEYGRSPGAVINVVTKSGTNGFHGAVFDFLRNNKLNARNYFRPAVEPLRQNQFGATMGGPVKRNRVFFFTSYEGSRVRSAAFRNAALTPTSAERNGDFSTYPAKQQPVDPENNQPFPGGAIPSSRLDPVALRIAEMLVPLPNTADGRLEATEPSTYDLDSGLGKLDYLISDRHKAYGSLFIARRRQFNPFQKGNIPGIGAANIVAAQHNIVVNEDWTVSPSALNQFRFGYTTDRYEMTGRQAPTWPDFGSRIVLGADPAKPPNVRTTGRWNLGAANTTVRPQWTINLSDTASLIRGSHSLKAGGWMLYGSYGEQSRL